MANENTYLYAGFALALWIKEDFNQLQDTRQIQQLTVATVNGLKRIVLQSSLPDMQVSFLFLFSLVSS